MELNKLCPLIKGDSNPPAFKAEVKQWLLNDLPYLYIFVYFGYYITEVWILKYVTQLLFLMI